MKDDTRCCGADPTPGTHHDSDCSNYRESDRQFPDLMPNVARMLNPVGSSMKDVIDELRKTDLTEYEIWLTIMGAAMCWDHVKEALNEYVATHNPNLVSPPV